MASPKARVLVVDDELELAQLFKDGLERFGYACRIAPTGRAALKLLEEEEADLVLVDITMPGMDGLTLFEHINDLYPDCGVCFVTAMDSLGTAVRQMKEGAYDYIVKPVTPSRLNEIVADALRKRSERMKEKEERQQRVRELQALNQLIQEYLRERHRWEELKGLVAERADRLTREAKAIHDMLSA